MNLDTYKLLKSNEGGPFKESKSGAGRWMEYILDRVEEGEVTLKLTIKKDMCNPLGGLHGGIYALIMDEAVGLALYTVCEDQFYTTVDLHVNLLWSAQEGDVITAIGKVIRRGKKIAYTEGAIYTEDGTLICRATSNLVNTGKKISDFYNNLTQSE